MDIVLTDGHKYRVTFHQGSYPSGEWYLYYKVWKFTEGDINERGNRKSDRSYQSLGWCKRYIKNNPQ